MYKPPTAINIKDVAHHQIRLAIFGAPSTGKTYAALTFPNPIVCDFDCKLGMHRQREDILILPFYDAEFCDKSCKVQRTPIANAGPNRRDAFLYWLIKEGVKLEPDQTLIIDSFSNLENAFDQQQNLEPSYTRNGKVDEFAFWGLKKEYYNKIFGILKSLHCSVIGIFHEQMERDDEGKLTSKLKPVMTGSIKDVVFGQFTDNFRQITTAKKDADGKVVGTQYWWQLASDSIANCCTSLPQLAGQRLIPAEYSALKIS